MSYFSDLIFLQAVIGIIGLKLLTRYDANVNITSASAESVAYEPYKKLGIL